jgi:nicotinamidase-related amidase
MLIEKSKSTLVIIDVQEKLVSVMPKPHTFIDNIIKLQKAAKALCIATYCSEQYPKGLGKTIKKIKENLDNKYYHLEKTEFSIPKNIGLQHLIICGIEAHVCVLQTAINLAKDKKVYVVQDAIASRNKKDYLTALGRLDKHPNIQIVSCEMVLFEWLRTFDHPEFKTISQLIK